MIQLVEYRQAHRDRLNELLASARRMGPAFKAEARTLVVNGNTIDRLNGVDRTGRPLRKWRWRLGRYKGATGATLAPFGQSSRAIKSFFAEWQGDTLRAGFRGPGVEILGYHATGTSGKGRLRYGKGGEPYFVGVKGRTTGIVRDVFGVSPGTRRDLIALFREHAANTFAARAGRFARGVSRRAASFFGGFFS